jgi:hypothetical protein
VKKNLLFIFSFFFSVGLYAQDASSTAVPARSISWYGRNVFFSWGLSPIMQDIYVEKFHYLRTDSIQFYGETHYNKYTIEGRISGFTFFSFNFHGRVNVKNIGDKASFSLNVPAGFGIGVIGTEQVFRFLGSKENGPDVEIISAHMHLPLFFCYNKGYHSTYNNIDRKGYYMGIGGQFTIAPLVSSKEFRKVEVDPFIFIPGIALGYKSHILENKQGVEFFLGFGHGIFLRATAVHTIRYKEE